jgi:CRP-like cAMP-binding protein
MEKIRQYFELIGPIPEKDWEIFVSKLIKREYSKKTMILRSGQTENYISFVDTGIVRFFIPNEANERTFAFIFDNELLSAYDSFLTQTPACYCAETINHTILWSFTYYDLLELYEKSPVSNVIGRIACEQLYLKKAKRELSLLNDSAGERYLKIFSERPKLLQQIPLKYIASYIGVTPQALSRIRNRIY